MMANELLELDEKLVEAVCRFACLWQVNSKAYKDNIAKENAWKAIGEQVYTYLQYVNAWRKGNTAMNLAFLTRSSVQQWTVRRGGSRYETDM